MKMSVGKYQESEANFLDQRDYPRGPTKQAFFECATAGSQKVQLACVDVSHSLYFIHKQTSLSK
jgi:hypothetical protein